MLPIPNSIFFLPKIGLSQDRRLAVSSISINIIYTENQPKVSQRKIQQYSRAAILIPGSNVLEGEFNFGLLVLNPSL